MTREILDKALEISGDMNTIYAIQSVLANSKGRFLATIEAKKFDSQKIVIEECRVINHVNLPEHIRKRFDEVLREELDKLESEFKEL